MIAPSGAFATYFDENFAFTDFPTSATPTIPDEWVTHDVVVI